MQVKLRDGREVTIRAARPDDKERLRAAFRRLSPESVYQRLFAHKRDLSETELKILTEIELDHDADLLATVVEDGEERVIASGTYAAFDAPGGERHAEVAFVVDEAFRGQGLASRLLQELVSLAREHGIVRFEAEVLPWNRAMRQVFESCGLPIVESDDGGTIHLSIALEDDPAGGASPERAV